MKRMKRIPYDRPLDSAGEISGRCRKRFSCGSLCRIHNEMEFGCLPRFVSQLTERAKPAKIPSDSTLGSKRGCMNTFLSICLVMASLGPVQGGSDHLDELFGGWEAAQQDFKSLVVEFTLEVNDRVFRTSEKR